MEKKNIFAVLMIQNFPKSITDTKQRTPKPKQTNKSTKQTNKLDLEISYSNLSKPMAKRKSWQKPQEKILCIGGIKIKITEDFSPEITQAKWELSEIV